MSEETTCISLFVTANSEKPANILERHLAVQLTKYNICVLQKSPTIRGSFAEHTYTADLYNTCIQVTFDKAGHVHSCWNDYYMTCIHLTLHTPDFWPSTTWIQLTFEDAMWIDYSIWKYAKSNDCSTTSIQLTLDEVRRLNSWLSIYGVASISRLLKISGLFCKRAL